MSGGGREGEEGSEGREGQGDRERGREARKESISKCVILTFTNVIYARLHYI